MDFTEFLTQAIALIVGGIKGIGDGIAGGISSIVKALLFETVGETTSMSSFASLAFILIAISLGFTLCRWVLNFFTSMGNRNR